MNDSDTVDIVRDCLTTAKDSLAGVHVNTPLDTIVRNGRARRRRHRLTGLTGAIAVTAGIALAVSALALSGHPASQSGHSASHPLIARLAAWTVAKQANGDITITIRPGCKARCVGTESRPLSVHPRSSTRRVSRTP